MNRYLLRSLLLSVFIRSHIVCWVQLCIDCDSDWMATELLLKVRKNWHILYLPCCIQAGCLVAVFPMIWPQFGGILSVWHSAQWSPCSPRSVFEFICCLRWMGCSQLWALEVIVLVLLDCVRSNSSHMWREMFLDLEQPVLNIKSWWRCW